MSSAAEKTQVVSCMKLDCSQNNMVGKSQRQWGITLNPMRRAFNATWIGSCGYANANPMRSLLSAQIRECVRVQSNASACVSRIPPRANPVAHQSVRSDCTRARSPVIGVVTSRRFRVTELLAFDIRVGFARYARILGFACCRICTEIARRKNTMGGSAQRVSKRIARVGISTPQATGERFGELRLEGLPASLAKSGAAKLTLLGSHRLQVQQRRSASREPRHIDHASYR